LDLPGIIEGAKDGKGRGRQVIAGIFLFPFFSLSFPFHPFHLLPYSHSLQILLTSVARTCSLIFMVLDVLKPLTHKKILERELEGYGIRLNKSPPNITFRKKSKGGLNITKTVQTPLFIYSFFIHSFIHFNKLFPLTKVPLTNLDTESIKAVCSEYKIHNADIVFRCDATADDLIDVIEGNRIYIPCIYALNKIDQISIQVSLFSTFFFCSLKTL